MPDKATWKKRIMAARQRREKKETAWKDYAVLFANLFVAEPDANEGRTVKFPDGDQVKVGAVHRAMEQTVAMMEVPEVTVSLELQEYDRELDREDSHREAIAAAAVTASLERSGIVGEDDSVGEAVKYSGVLFGSGIVYTHYERVEEEVEVSRTPVYREEAPGRIAPELEPDGITPMFELNTETRVTWQRVKDCHVPVNEHLFDARARTIRDATWQGWERIVPLAELREDPFLEVPANVKGTSVRRKDIYGTEETEEQVAEEDAVRHIVIWDRMERKLIHFLEASTVDDKGDPGERDLMELKSIDYPVRFDDPDIGPFTDWVPKPLPDDPFGSSQVEHIKTLAMEIDKLRTRAANLTRQLKVVLLYQKGKIDEDQMRTALRSDDAEAVGVDKQDEDDWNKLIKQVDPARIPPDVYTQIAQAEQDIRRAEGVSEEALGGAQTATESENNMSIGGARINRKRRLWLAFMARLARRHIAMLRTFGPEGQPILVQGADGQPLFLEYGRDVFRGRYRISISPGGEAAAVSPVEQKMLIELSNLLLGRFSPQADRIWLRQLLTRLRIRDINALLGALPMEWPGGLPPGGTDGKARAGAFNPNDQTNGQAIRSATNALNEGSML